tara:strand:+ start:1916 stop:2368 length:453 start_codon:yes stop_codon:yes gene_type:complete
VKLINYSLIVFIFIFVILSVSIDPLESDNDYSNDPPYDIPEVNLNITLNEDVYIDDDINLDSTKPKNMLKKNSQDIWTVKINTYKNLEKLNIDLTKLKASGYKVYSRYESNSEDVYALYIGPTLKRNDSLRVLKELDNMEGLDPEIRKYD